MSNSPEFFAHTDLRDFTSGAAYHGLEQWKNVWLPLDIAPNSDTNSFLATKVLGTARYKGTGFIEGKIQVFPDQKREILVTRGMRMPPDVTLSLYVYGTGTLNINPIPVVAVHHTDSRTVFGPKSGYTGVVFDSYVMPILPFPGAQWTSIGISDEAFSSPIEEALFGDDPDRFALVRVRTIVGKAQWEEMQTFLKET